MNVFLSKLQKNTAILLIIMLLLSMPSLALDIHPNTELALNKTAEYLLHSIPEAGYGSVGGEWVVIGLARSDYNVPQSFYDAYYNNLVSYVKASKGILSKNKYTEYSRVVLALTAIGKNPENVGGYNLLAPLGDYNAVIRQGINGPIFALLALDSLSYEMPVCTEAEIQASRNLYIEYILEKQLENGGWSLYGDTAEPDVTGMALMALAKYKDNARVKTAIDKAVICLSQLQNNDGGFSSGGIPNTESTSQVIMALCELGIDPSDSLFTKGNNALSNSIMNYYIAGGGFKHSINDTSPNLMATEQGFYALVSLMRFKKGQNSFYDMSDVSVPDTKPAPKTGLLNKHPDIEFMPVTAEGKTFADIKGHKYQTAIEALSCRTIINGISNQAFEPDRTITRAEFASIVVRSLGLPLASNSIFSDVEANSWYFPYVGAAYSYGIVNGTSSTAFTPYTAITREEAAVMTARASKLCGLDTEMTDKEIKDMLMQFSDFNACSNWARQSLTFCFKAGIISKENSSIKPKEAVTRAEIADMLYHMLINAELI